MKIFESKIFKTISKITTVIFVIAAILGGVFLKMGVSIYSPRLKSLQKEFHKTKEIYTEQLDINVFNQYEYVTPRGFKIDIIDVVENGDYININFMANASEFIPKKLDEKTKEPIEIPIKYQNNDEEIATLSARALSSDVDIYSDPELYESIIQNGMFTSYPKALKFEALTFIPAEMANYIGCFIATPMSMPNNPNMQSKQTGVFYSPTEFQRVFSVCVNKTKTQLVAIDILYNYGLGTDNEVIYFNLGKSITNN